MSSLLLLVTGASKGLGSAAACAFCKHIDVARIRALLVARSQDGLDETKERMQKAAATRGIALEATSHAMDLSNLDTLDDDIDALVEQATATTSFDRVVLINNAGSLGHLGPLMELPSLEDLQMTLDFNVTSALWLSIRFARAISDTSSCVVVNISSLCAIQPFPTMGVYSTGKAARDSFHQVWSKELGENSNLKLLNYAPGALETDMTVDLQQAEKLDPELQSFFRDSAKKGELISPQDTARRMAKLVWKNEFESGSHIDYWDLSDD
jgi:sepiapterin reductase